MISEDQRGILILKQVVLRIQQEQAQQRKNQLRNGDFINLVSSSEESDTEEEQQNFLVDEESNTSSSSS